MINRPYLITFRSEQENEPTAYLAGVKRFYNSVEKFEDSMEHIDIIYKGAYPGHMYRWDFIRVIMKDKDPSRWWVFTDTPDVVFQTPFPDFDKIAPWVQIIPASEGQTHKENPWWVNQFETTWPHYKDLLWDKTVYNVGSWAMRGAQAMEFIDYMSRKANEPGIDYNLCEQAEFNVWLQEHRDRANEYSTLFTCLHDSMNNGNARKTEQGIWVNRHGEPYTVVHGNGSTKAYL